ncbi:unnamed protein product [Arabis nemorensis]|uniref:F-box domain-containing protein n=1 Tax=Arabis nemorensis TaxID=586526 RepID=A0A565BYY4_9BRAS|nr:unnamed protein product [Arabis nemorensis]
MDRLSNLPDEIICHIGSFLSAKEAAFTTLLSKRWQNLITIKQTLHFDDSIESFKDFADRLSSLQVTSRVRKLSLKWWSLESDRVNHCLRDVLKCGVLDLNLWINGKQGYSLPFEVFTCKTVVKLSLGFRFSIDMIPENALLPSLKTLSLNDLKFFEFGGNCAFQTLLAACPVLEELFLSDVNWEQWKWSRTVSSLSLKRLTIIRTKWDDYDTSGFKSISFDTPGLVYLYYSDYVPKEYLNVNLNSLVEAKIILRPQENHIWNERHGDPFYPMNLLQGLKNVEILNLHSYQTLMMFYVFREALPVFEKLSHLSVNLSRYCWFPIKFMGSLHFRKFNSLCHCLSEFSFLDSCPLEVLKITEYFGNQQELRQMEYILGKLSCLELVQIHFPMATGEKKAKLEYKLQKLPRASSKCKFNVVV